MFTHYRVRGLVLDKEDRGEADRLFTIFTKDFGKLNLLAKGERKITSKLRGGLETFCLSEVEFIQGKAHKTLTDAISIENFKNIRRDLGKLRVAYRISQALLSILKLEETDEDIWNLIDEVFYGLNNCFPAGDVPKEQKLPIIYYYFLWNLFAVLGYKPELYECAICSKAAKPDNLYFSCVEGGIICTACLPKAKLPAKVSPDVIKIARLLLAKNWKLLQRLNIGQSNLQELALLSKRYLDSIK